VNTNQDHYDFLVFIGRFQPFHQGHLKILETALEQSQKLIILIGSAHRPRCTRNPWTYAERENMIRCGLDQETNERIIIAPIMDAMYNDSLWTTTIQKAVAGMISTHHDQPHREPRLGLIGHAKDHTSYYLKLFPQWPSIDVKSDNAISGTKIRDAIFNADQGHWEDDRLSMQSLVNPYVSNHVLSYLKQFAKTETFTQLREEFDFIRSYRARWEQSPYAPSFVTVDAVVVQSAHVLLVERRARPGKGQWALPGGFLGSNENLLDACLRELKEETKIKVPWPVLNGSIVQQKVFDDPHRSARGRTITHAFYIHLAADTQLPKVKGGDDARKAFWVPLAQLEPRKMFEDHYFIIQNMIGQSV